MKFPTGLIALCIGLSHGQLTPNYTSPLGVEVYNPDQLFDVSGPWSLMTKAGNVLYISGRCSDLEFHTMSRSPIHRHARILSLQHDARPGRLAARRASLLEHAAARQARRCGPGRLTRLPILLRINVFRPTALG